MFVPRDFNSVRSTPCVLHAKIQPPATVRLHYQGLLRLLLRSLSFSTAGEKSLLYQFSCSLLSLTAAESIGVPNQIIGDDSTTKTCED
ncbi:hypothetical protein DY000_02022676 [Brassica cretica]|uniref:Uncharacterized protein n=1 Tax=Brassica cretica TaxID=69181 RepID=A0ABQ7E0U7_BRACR|nr:hypothetical protein DY000_02022676 [Brassica cretica]